MSAHGLYAKNYYCKQYSECNQCIKTSSNNVVYTLSGLLTRSDSMRMLMQCIHSLHAARFDTSWSRASPGDGLDNRGSGSGVKLQTWPTPTPRPFPRKKNTGSVSVPGTLSGESGVDITDYMLRGDGTALSWTVFQLLPILRFTQKVKSFLRSASTYYTYNTYKWFITRTMSNKMIESEALLLESVVLCTT